MKAQRGDRTQISSLSLAFLSNMAAMLLMVLIMRPTPQAKSPLEMLFAQKLATMLRPKMPIAKYSAGPNARATFAI